jgi:uncharacterized protein
MGLDLITVPRGAQVTLELRAESVMEGVLVSGEASATAIGECGRCLIEVTDRIVANICELYAYPDSATDETTDSDEVLRLTGDLIDLEPVVRDALVLALPATPLCRPDCRGLCPECGERLDDLPAEHTHAVTDPRWGALQSLVISPETPAGASSERESPPGETEEK